MLNNRSGQPLATLLRLSPLQTLFAGMLVIVVGINALQFMDIDQRRSDRFKALHAYESSDIMTEAFAEDSDMVERYARYEVLAYLAPNSTIVVDSTYGKPRRTVHRFYGFGDAQSVTFAALSEELIAGVEGLDAYAVAKFPGPGVEGHRPWAIFVDPANGKVGDPNDPYGFVRDLLSTTWLPATTSPAREFYYLRDYSSPSSDSEFRMVFIETSLVPEDLKTEEPR